MRLASPHTPLSLVSRCKRHDGEEPLANLLSIIVISAIWTHPRDCIFSEFSALTITNTTHQSLSQCSFWQLFEDETVIEWNRCRRVTL